jgi:hypothetical protein
MIKARILFVLLLGVYATAYACEPVIPMMFALGGPILLTRSLVMLAAAVLLKCALFAVFQKEISFPLAGLFMFLGNILSTIGGLLVGLMMTSPGIVVVVLPIVFLLCWLPARRVHTIIPRWHLRSYVVALIMTVGLLASLFLFMSAQSAAAHFDLVGYWIAKLAAVYVAIIISMALSALWEEWVIWKMSRRPAEDNGFIKPVVRANLYTMLAVMLYGAILIMPERMRSNDFLVKLYETVSHAVAHLIST